MAERSQGDGALVQLSERLTNSAAFSNLFREGMDLVEETAAYLDGVGRTEARALERAVSLQPENPAARYHLAIAYSRTGRKQEAERESEAFKQASEKARQMKQDVQTGVLGPQKAEP